MNIPLGNPNVFARIGGDVNNPQLHGSVYFYEMSGGVLVTAEIYGLPPTDTGIFAFHIHQGNSCTGDAFSDSGSHYNPQNTEHPKHAGDLPPLFSCKGRAFTAVLTDRFTTKQIIGKTIVIHAQPDDFRTQPAGAAGVKIGCGTIEPV